MTKIGIFGGAFDPITLGHLEMIERATGFFDEVLVMPAYNHADGKEMQPFNTRLMMIYSAICEKGLQLKGARPIWFEATLDECQTSKVVKKLIHAVRSNKGDFDADNIKFSFIIGEDAVENIETWEGYEELKTLVNFYVFKRFEGKRSKLSEIRKDRWYNQEPHRVLERVPHSSFSSTAVRKMIREGSDFSGGVCKSVYDFIKTYRLYA